MTHVVPDMWTVPSRHMPARLSGGRPSLVVSADVAAVLLEGSHDELPLVCEWRDDVGNRWKRYELPAVSGEEEFGSQSELLRLTIQSVAGDTEFLEVLLRDGTPHPGQDDSLVAEEEQAGSACNRWVLAGEHAMRMIAEHVDWAKRLVEQPVGNGDGFHADEPWNRRAAGLVAPSVDRALEEWKQNRENEPRLAVIVEIARKHESLINSICQRPRRVLARSRQVVGLGRVQEIDSACLRWLARQPGRSVAERAGVRQRVMGIVRLESAETPENRVAKDFLRRAITACGRYQREYRDFPDHSRVKLVTRFRRILIDLLLNSEIAGVRPPVGVAQPNYVLQHDSRYRVLWHEYVKLVHEQTAEDDLWRWQHRTWSEVCSIAAQTILAGWCEAGSALRADVWLHSEQVAGRFVSPWTMSGRWELCERGEVAGGGVVDFIAGQMINAEAADAHSGDNWQTSLRPFSPDFVLMRLRENGEPSALVPVWTVFDFDIVNEARLAERTSAISEQLASIQDGVPIRGLILQPALTTQPSASDNAEAAHCLGTRLCLPMQTRLDDLRVLLLGGLE